MSAEQQLVPARAALRAGDRVRARQLLGDLLRQDPTLVEGWLLLSQAMNTQPATEWCLQCAARFVRVDEVGLASTSPHPGGTNGDSTSSAQVQPAPSETDHQPAPEGPREPHATERPRQTSYWLAEAWEALEANGLQQDPELASVSRALETRRQATRRRTGAERGRPAAPARPSSGVGPHQANLSTPGSGKGDTENHSAQDQTPTEDDPHTSASMPRTEGPDKDRRPAGNPTAGRRPSSTTWRPVYLEPARTFLEEEEPGGVRAGLSGLAGRALRALRKRITRVERRARSVAQLLLFVVGVLLLCNGASLLYPRVIASLQGDPWLAEAAPALGAQGEAKPLSSPITKVLAPSAPRVSQSLQREADPSTARTTSPTSSAVGQNANPTPAPQAPDPLQASLASSDLPETRSKPDVIVNKAVPTRVIIPALGLDAPVVPITSTIREIQGRQVRSWDVPSDGAAGWHIESSPLGVVGNTVLNGHNTTEGEVFRDLHRLQPGDEVIVLAGNEQHTYTVATTTVYREGGAPLERRLEHARLLAATEDRRLTLITCHPYGSTLNRLVVTCFPRGDRTERGYLRE